MASLPSNRGVPKFGTAVASPLPTRIQVDSFGGTQAAPAGGALVTGRPAAPRPAITVQGSAQGKESFGSDPTLDRSVARALNSLQDKISDSTAKTRANPLGGGHLFQNVPVVGTATSGLMAARPPKTGLPDGFLYFGTALGKPFWLSGSNWVDATGAVSFPATSGTLAVTVINHGFGRPATGFIISNVQNAVIQGQPRSVPVTSSIDNNTLQIWLAYTALSSSPTMDVYVF